MTTAFLTPGREAMKVSIEKQDDGSYIAYNVDGGSATIIGTGNTVGEAKADFFNSISEAKAAYGEEEKMPDCLNEPIDFHFDISSLFEYYSMLNVSALARYLGINESLLRQYRSGNAPISDRQLEKIEDGIHRLGSELAALRLL